MTWLSGKKTYIIAIVWGVAVVANLLGLIDHSTLQIIETVLLPLGLATLRAGVNKVCQ